MSEKTIVYTPEGGSGSAGLGMLGMLAPFMQRSGIDPSTLVAALSRNGNGGDWMSWIIPLIAVVGIFGGFNNGNGGGLFGGGNNNANTAALANLINNNEGRDKLAQAIAGNHEAIRDIAVMLNTSIATVQSGINAANLAIQQVGNQVGMSSLQVINAIQSGNADLISKMASCCCETREAITAQGYENRLATLQQTDALASKIDQQTTLINDKFCQLEMRELQNKLAASQLENSNLRGEISQGNQNALLTNFMAQQIAPINAQLAALGREVDDVKCKLPQTVNVPYPQLAAVPAYAAYGMYANGLAYGYGYGYGGGNGFFG